MPRAKLWLRHKPSWKSKAGANFCQSVDQPINLNENGEEDQGPDPEDNDKVVDSECEGDQNEGEEESLAFEGIFEQAQLLWLDTYGFSQNQLKLVEVTCCSTAC